MPNFIDILALQQLAVLHPGGMLEIMRLHARMRQHKNGIVQTLHALDIRKQRTNRRLPLIPRACGRETHTGIVLHDACVVSGEMVCAFGLGQEMQELFKRLGMQHCRAPVRYGPLELCVSAGEDAAQNKAAHALRVRLRIRQPQRRAPGAAEDDVPFGDLQVLAERFDVRDQVPGGVVGGVCVWAGEAAASLVQQDDAVVLWVEEDGVGFCAAPAGPAVEVDHCVPCECGIDDPTHGRVCYVQGFPSRFPYCW